jgi:hypothetical protein
VRIETPIGGQKSSILTLVSHTDGPLTPEFDTNEIGNALD